MEDKTKTPAESKEEWAEAGRTFWENKLRQECLVRSNMDLEDVKDIAALMLWWLIHFKIDKSATSDRIEEAYQLFLRIANK